MPAALRAEDSGAATADRPDTADRARLFEIIFRRSFGRRKVVLASGRESDFYFDLKPSMLDPHGAHLMAAALTREIVASGARYVGGLEMGAVPITGAVCQYSYQTGTPITGLFVRKKPKAHGAMNSVEGLAPGETLAGSTVVIVEDVTTSGGSALIAIQACVDQGAKVVLAISVVDREEGAAEAFAAAGVPFKSLFTANEFLARG